MANTPLEFMLEGSSIVLDMMYVVPGAPLPQPPEHDVALVAIDGSDAAAPALREVTQIVKSWPRPVVNAPERIARLTRAGTWELLKSAPGIVMPMNVRIDRVDTGQNRRRRSCDRVHSRWQRVPDHRAAVLVAGRNRAGEARRCFGDRRLSARMGGRGILRRAVCRLQQAATAYSANAASCSSMAAPMWPTWRCRSIG